MEPEELRVLGSLIEKQFTTPEYYPLTLNALVAACNQKNNRDPVVAYDEATVVRALDRLRDRRLAAMVTTAGSRVPKYKHVFPETIGLDERDTAVLCELMLRGPQTAAELRARGERFTPMGEAAEVQAVLDGLAQRPTGALVVKLPRQPGQKESRYAHLLGEPPSLDAAPPPPEPAAVQVRAEAQRIAQLEADVAALRAEVTDLRAQLETFRRQFE
ncbi:MAG TPA: YceH family protein [Kiritimatiellia bacterium]|nr:YceH family protein [Kiritimatiellia bacterium]